MSKMAKVPLVPAKVNLKRRIPGHYINFTFTYIVEIVYPP